MLCRRAAYWVISGLPVQAVQQQTARPMNGVATLSAWNGLDGWRVAPIDERRSWGTKNVPVVEQEQLPHLGAGGLELSSVIASSALKPIAVGEIGEEPVTELVGGGVLVSGAQLGIGDLASWGRLVLVTADPLVKAWLTHQAYLLWRNDELDVGVATAPDTPGRPPKPELVPPRQVPSPKDCKLPPSAHMLHNLAHIELNAIDLAWDTVVRFSHASEELGTQFFSDFLHVADDESRHFRWCSQRLSELGYNYGDMPAHNMLWQDCMKTSGDVKSRLAVIPMMQEARGLDAGPRLVKKLLGSDDHRSAAIVRRIGQEEVAHVGVGVFHFLRICEKMGVEPGDEFKDLLKELQIELHGPFNHKARELAGLRREWYDNSESKELPEVEQKPQRFGWRGRDRKRKENIEYSSNLSNLLKQPKDGPKEVDDKPVSALQSSVTEDNECHVPAKSKGGFLPKVYERLAMLVAMEKENAGT